MNTKSLFKQFLPLFSALLLIVACSDDDSAPQNTIEEDREETIVALTNTWRISQATLNNNTLDISQNFNVVDDEFIFKADGTLIWRPGNDINFEGTTNQETLLDYYRSPINSTFTFNENSSTKLTALSGSFVFEVIDSNTITGILSSTGNNVGELNITLTNKEQSDYISAPANALNFTEVFTFQSNGIQGQAPGMICSYSDNSLFLVTREQNASGIHERVIKWDLETSNQTEYLFYNEDYVSKQIQIVNNKLVVVGGQFVNTFPLDLSTEPTSVNHGLAITRFGTGFSDNEAYIIGGDLDIDGDQNIEAEKIYKWNLLDQSLSNVTDLPEDRFGARATLINDKLYVFGGTTEFASPDPNINNTIYIYDINNGDLSTELMNTALEYSFVDKHQNMIYVGGYQNIYDNEGTFIDSINTFGVYNTEDGTYQEIESNLNQQGFYIIQGMCVFNGKMYVIYTNSDIENSWQIMAADL